MKAWTSTALSLLGWLQGRSAVVGWPSMLSKTAKPAEPAACDRIEIASSRLPL